MYSYECIDCICKHKCRCLRCWSALPNLLLSSDHACLVSWKHKWSQVNSLLCCVDIGQTLICTVQLQYQSDDDRMKESMNAWRDLCWKSCVCGFFAVCVCVFTAFLRIIFTLNHVNTGKPESSQLLLSFRWCLLFNVRKLSSDCCKNWYFQKIGHMFVLFCNNTTLIKMHWSWPSHLKVNEMIKVLKIKKQTCYQETDAKNL